VSIFVEVRFLKKQPVYLHAGCRV